MNEFILNQESIKGHLFIVIVRKKTDIAQFNKLNLLFPAVGIDLINIKIEDCHCLQNKKLVLWPDNSKTGRAWAIKAIDKLLVEFKFDIETTMIVSTPADDDEKLSPKDYLLQLQTQANISSFIKKNLIECNKYIEQNQDFEAPPKEEFEITEPLEKIDREKRYFMPVGYEKGLYYYLSYLTGQIVSLRPTDHKIHNLCQLAPLVFWEMEYQDQINQKNGWSFIADELMEKCHKMGVFDPDNCRGRGAWTDEGKTVIHLGDHLIYNGKPLDPRKIKSKFIYEKSKRLANFYSDKPLETKEAKYILSLLKRLPFENPNYYKMLAGWLVIAPICGVLSWRPHAWVTGGAGTGKSWIIEHIVKRVIGTIAIQAEGTETTEAGIRQKLGHDARPVIHDEADAENRQALDELQKKINLARSSSSDTGADFIKGTSGHKAVSFKARAMFLFASINVNLKMQSDLSRFIVFEMVARKARNKENFNNIKMIMAKLITKEYCEDFRSRTIKNIPLIKGNISTFEKAGMEYYGNQRTADQFAGMFAGYVLCKSDRKISYDDALRIIKEANINPKTEEVRGDEVKCLDAILQETIKVEEDGRSYSYSIGELINFVAYEKGNFQSLPHPTIEITLNRYGIKVDADNVYISNSNKQLSRILKDTPWAEKWRPVLKRYCSEYMKDSGSIRWADGTKSRATPIPLSLIYRGEE